MGPRRERADSAILGTISPYLPGFASSARAPATSISPALPAVTSSSGPGPLELSFVLPGTTSISPIPPPSTSSSVSPHH